MPQQYRRVLTNEVVGERSTYHVVCLVWIKNRTDEPTAMHEHQCWSRALGDWLPARALDRDECIQRQVDSTLVAGPSVYEPCVCCS